MKLKKLLVALALPAVAAACTLAWANAPVARPEAGVKADRVRVRKAERTLELMKGEEVLIRYSISLGFDPEGPKKCEGDGRTPEGVYAVDLHKFDSSFHRALRINYPHPAQVLEAAKEGKKPGSQIMIHGLRNGMGWIGRLHRLCDWTAGCIALSNPEIEVIWDAVDDGTPVEVLP